MDFKIIDNFLSDFDYQLALSIVEDDNTTWRCGEVVFVELLNSPIQFNRQFSHFIHVEDKSTMYYLVLLPILKILNIKDENIIRPGFDMVFRSAYLLFGPQKVNIQPKVQKLEKNNFFKKI